MVELRAFAKGGKKRTDAGYFDAAHWPDLAEAAVKLSRSHAAVYTTLNPVDPQLLNRCCNRIEAFAKATCTDKQIVSRRWFLIDLDPARPADTSATDDQVNAAHRKATAIHKHLKAAGWPAPTVAKSGNGYHLLFAIDLPNDDASTALLKAALAALASRFDDNQIKVDQTVFNAGRIVKLYGTLATKGDSTVAAPWRVSELLKTPDRVLVTADQLRELGAIAAPAKPAPKQPRQQKRESEFKLEAFLAEHGIEHEADQHGTRERFKLATCPFNAEHASGDAAIFREPSGKLGFKCLHSSCADKQWSDVRVLFEGPKAPWQPASRLPEPPAQWDHGAFPDDLQPDYSGVSDGSIIAGEGFPLGSEQALAEDFTWAAAGRFRWTSGLDWMTNCGSHWERDINLQRYTLAKRVCQTATHNPVIKSQVKICSAATANAVISLARSNSGIVTPVAEWDKHPMVLNTPTDAIDLETGYPVSRDGLLFTQVCAVAPARSKTPAWDKFLLEIFAGDLEMVEFMQRLAGYSFTGSVKEQKLFFMHGSGANGKSVLLDAWRAIAGCYAHNLPSEALMTSRNEGHPTMFASLHGKRMAISSEIEESAHWAESRIKSLTGDENLTARFMQKDFFTFRVSHKHLIAGNFKPRLKGDDFAMARRMILIPFNQRFEGAKRDNNLSQKLKAEYPGILQWAVDGAVKWARGGLAIPNQITEASAAYMSANDDIQLWLTDCCTRLNGLTAKSADLYASFSKWKDAQGEHAPSAKSFSQRLERSFTKKRTSQGFEFQGIALALDAFGNNYYDRASRGE